MHSTDYCLWGHMKTEPFVPGLWTYLTVAYFCAWASKLLCRMYIKQWQVFAKFLRRDFKTSQPSKTLNIFIGILLLSQLGFKCNLLSWWHHPAHWNSQNRRFSSLDRAEFSKVTSQWYPGRALWKAALPHTYSFNGKELGVPSLRCHKCKATQWDKWDSLKVLTTFIHSLQTHIEALGVKI